MAVCLFFKVGQCTQTSFNVNLNYNIKTNQALLHMQQFTKYKNCIYLCIHN